MPLQVDWVGHSFEIGFPKLKIQFSKIIYFSIYAKILEFVYLPLTLFAALNNTFF